MWKKKLVIYCVYLTNRTENGFACISHFHSHIQIVVATHAWPHGHPLPLLYWAYWKLCTGCCPTSLSHCLPEAGFDSAWLWSCGRTTLLPNLYNSITEVSGWYLHRRTDFIVVRAKPVSGKRGFLSARYPSCRKVKKLLSRGNEACTVLRTRVENMVTS